MANNALVQVRVDSDLKNAADALFNRLGLDTPTAIRMFLSQAVYQHGIPFEIVMQTPNEETVAAMLEAKRIAHDPNAKKYSSAAELFAELGAESDDEA